MKNKRKNIVLGILLLFVSIHSYSQKTDEKFLKKQLAEIESLNKKDSLQFSNSEIPDSLKKESAVIIAKKIEQYYYTSVGHTLPPDKYRIYKNYYHERVKILDLAALEKYSMLFYPKTESAIISITKPNDDNIKIDASAAVEAPEYKSNTYSYKKIALPNLEVGDIVDFSYLFFDTISDPFVSTIYYPTIITQLQDEYPILYFTLDFNIQKTRHYFSFKSTNGAPELHYNGEAGRFANYSLTQNYLPKYTDKLFFYENRELPTIKFNVVYGNFNNDGLILNLLDKKGKAKTSLSQKEIIKHAYTYKYDSNLYNYFSDYKKSIINQLKQQYIRQSTTPGTYGVTGAKALSSISKYDLAKLIYYNIRDYNLNNITNRTKLLTENRTIEYPTYKRLAALFENYKINFSFVVSPNKLYSSLEDMLLKDEVIVSILVEEDGKKLLIPPYNMYSSIDNSWQIEGCKSYIISNEKSSRKATIKEFKTEETPTESNSTKTHAIVQLDLENQIIKVSRRKNIKGNSKLKYQYALVTSKDYWNATMDYWKYSDTSIATTKNYIKNDFERKLDDNYKSQNKERTDFLKTELEDKYEVVDYHFISILSVGKYSDSLCFEDDFKLKNILIKTGDDYQIKIGELLTERIDIDNKNINREFDLNIDYAKQFVTEMYIEIPTGYTVNGLEGLNILVDNESGMFMSEAIIQNNKLTIKTTLEFKKAFDKKENWSNWQSFLSAASDYFHKKVLLEKLTLNEM